MCHLRAVLQALELELLGLLPGVAGVTKVTVGSGLQVLGLLEVELPDDDTGPQVPVVADDLDHVEVGNLSGTVRVDVNREGLSNTNGIGQLNEDSSAETGGNQRLGDPSSGVGSRSVDLGEVLSGESTTSVSTPSTISVNDNLSASQTSITLGSSDDESTRGLDVVDSLVVQKLGVNDLVDDLFLDLCSEVLGADLLGVLGGDDDSVNSEGNNGTVGVLLVLDGDLGLGVGSQPTHGSIPTSISHGSVELVGKHDGLGHQLGSLVGGVSEHDTLVTSTVVLQVTVVETLSDIRGLLLNGDQNVTGLVVETHFTGVVSNLGNGLTDNLLVVNLGLGGDFTKDHDHTGLGSGLTSHPVVSKRTGRQKDNLLTCILEHRLTWSGGLARDKHREWRQRPGHRSCRGVLDR